MTGINVRHDEHIDVDCALSCSPFSKKPVLSLSKEGPGGFFLNVILSLSKGDLGKAEIMAKDYRNQLEGILRKVRPRLTSTHDLKFKNCFGAVAGQRDAGPIFKLRMETIACR